MRPQNTILLMCDAVEREEQIRFILRVHGYRVFSDANIDQRAAVVVQSRIGQPSELVNELKIPILFLNEARAEGCDTLNVAAYYPTSVPTEEWIGRLKILTARKRGPKKAVAA